MLLCLFPLTQVSWTYASYLASTDRRSPISQPLYTGLRDKCRLLLISIEYGVDSSVPLLWHWLGLDCPSLSLGFVRTKTKARESSVQANHHCRLLFGSQFPAAQHKPWSLPSQVQPSSNIWQPSMGVIKLPVFVVCLGLQKQYQALGSMDGRPHLAWQVMSLI